MLYELRIFQDFLSFKLYSFKAQADNAIILLSLITIKLNLIAGKSNQLLTNVFLLSRDIRLIFVLL